MSKLIINNLAGLSDEEALKRVTEIVRCGKISVGSNGEQYCFATTYKDGTIVFVEKRSSGTQTFTIKKG